ncbi:MAG: histidinol-phosphate transaminase [Deferribacteres bacterium]|nr:histidinol-phosphate transaminase [Deferribacteres bacterium]
MNIRRLVKPNIRGLKAYRAEEIPCRVKLDANESPYGFSVLRSVRINRYPDPEAKTLRGLVAREFRVKPENILHGNGSDELIYNLIATFGGPTAYPVPTFSMYGILSQALNETGIEIPLDEKFDLDTERFLGVIKKRKPKLIFLSSPNNPTGNRFSSDRIWKIIKASKGMVVVDEAYQPFSGRNEFLPLLGKYGNLIVLRTLSKIGLAGLRVGFMMAGADIINEVNKVRLPFNLNSLSQHVAVAALRNRERMRSYIRSVVSERKRLFKEMKKTEGIEPYPSQANFILFRIRGNAGSVSANRNAADRIYEGLLHKGILVRNMKGIFDGCLRVTIGTPRENTAFLKALRQLL